VPDAAYSFAPRTHQLCHQKDLTSSHATFVSLLILNLLHSHRARQGSAADMAAQTSNDDSGDQQRGQQSPRHSMTDTMPAGRRELEKEALQTWQRLHADLAGAELIEVPPSGALPLACHIVLMRGSATLTSADHTSVRPPITPTALTLRCARMQTLCFNQPAKPSSASPTWRCRAGLACQH